MKKTVNTNPASLILIFLFGACLIGYLAFKAGEASGMSKAAALIRAFNNAPANQETSQASNNEDNIERELMRLFAADATGYEVLQTSNGVQMAFMPQYGRDLLGSTKLESDTVYRVRMDVPQIHWNRDGRTVDSIYYAANQISVEFCYPTQVKAGESGRIVVKASFNGADEPLIGVIDFVAAEDLRLINGDSSPSSYSGGGDIDFCDGAIEIEFYTSATNDFNRPSRVSSLGHDDIVCKMRPY